MCRIVPKDLNKLVLELTYLILVSRMATKKLDVEKFTGDNDFHLWRLKMRVSLVHQGIEEVLEDS